MLRTRSRVAGTLPILFLAASSTGGCDSNTEGYTLNHAVEMSRRKNKDNLSIIRTIAKERRTEQKGIYSFFDAEEPATGGRPFVVQSRQKLLYDHEYLLLGRVVPWRDHQTELFLVEDVVTPFPWPWVIGVVVLVAAALASWRYIHDIRNFIDHKIKPPPPPKQEARTVTHVKGSLFDMPMAESPFPSLLVEPGTPATASKYSAFHLEYNEDSPKKRWDDEKQQECIVYGFGRQSDANDFVLSEDYVSRKNHFRVTIYEDKSAYLEVNPKAGTPVQVTRPDNTVLPLAPNHPQRLENGYIVTIGDIKLRYSVPSHK